MAIPFRYATVSVNETSSFYSIMKYYCYRQYRVTFEEYIKYNKINASSNNVCVCYNTVFYVLRICSGHVCFQHHRKRFVYIIVSQIADFEIQQAHIESFGI